MMRVFRKSFAYLLACIALGSFLAGYWLYRVAHTPERIRIISSGSGAVAVIDTQGIYTVILASDNPRAVEDVAQVVPWYTHHIDTLIIPYNTTPYLIASYEVVERYRPSLVIMSHTDGSGTQWMMFNDVLRDIPMLTVRSLAVFNHITTPTIHISRGCNDVHDETCDDVVISDQAFVLTIYTADRVLAFHSSVPSHETERIVAPLHDCTKPMFLPEHMQTHSQIVDPCRAIIELSRHEDAIQARQ